MPVSMSAWRELLSAHRVLAGDDLDARFPGFVDAVADDRIGLQHADAGAVGDDLDVDVRGAEVGLDVARIVEREVPLRGLGVAHLDDDPAALGGGLRLCAPARRREARAAASTRRRTSGECLLRPCFSWDAIGVRPLVAPVASHAHYRRFGAPARLRGCHYRRCRLSSAQSDSKHPGAHAVSAIALIVAACACFTTVDVTVKI